MKRVIIILWIVLVSSGWLMANHWTPNSTPYENNMTLTGVVRIDGIEQQTTALEVGAFCGEEWRGSARLAFFPPTQRYVVQIVISGNSGDQITFRLYDHEQNEELDLIADDIVTFTSDGYGSLANPYMLNFYSAPPGPHSITVSADPEVGGIVTGGGSYNHGATATLTAMANEDYRFVNWTKDGEVVSNRATFSFTVIEPGNYVANFELNIIHHWVPNSMSYESNMTLTGIIQINGQEQQNPMLEVGVFCGEECRGSGTPAYFEPMQRYVVQILIYGEDGDQLTFRLYDHEFNEELELYPTHNVTFTTNGYGSLVNPYVLNFTEMATTLHTITATVNLEGSGTVMGTGTYSNGTTCTLTATSNDNYQFVNWTENGTMVSVSSTYAFEVTSDRSLVANFVPVESNHWTPNTAPYGGNMTLTGIVQINSVEQQTAALEVGAFCGEECRGAGRLAFFSPTQRYVIQLIIYGNEGDQLTFKLYDHALGEELDVISPEAVSFTANGYGTLGNPYVLNFGLPIVTQTLTLTEGWNWFSTYLEADDLLEQLEESLGTSGIRIQGKNGTVDRFDYQGNSYWYGSLTDLTNEQMYKVRTNAACNVVIVGAEASPADHPITISNGWNWIGFPCSQSVSLETALSGFTPEPNDMIKGKDGAATYISNGNVSMWYGTLDTLDLRPDGDFPVRDFATVCFESSSLRQRAMILGGVDKHGEEMNSRWCLEYSTHPLDQKGIYRVQDFSEGRDQFAPVSGAAVVAYKKQLLLFRHSHIMVSTDEGLNWTKADSTKNRLPETLRSRQYQTAIVHDKNIYLFGGQSELIVHSDVCRGRLNSIDWK